MKPLPKLCTISQKCQCREWKISTLGLLPLPFVCLPEHEDPMAEDASHFEHRTWRNWDGAGLNPTPQGLALLILKVLKEAISSRAQLQTIWMIGPTRCPPIMQQWHFYLMDNQQLPNWNLRHTQQEGIHAWYFKPSQLFTHAWTGHRPEQRIAYYCLLPKSVQFLTVL